MTSDWLWGVGDSQIINSWAARLPRNTGNRVRRIKDNPDLDIGQFSVSKMKAFTIICHCVMNCSTAAAVFCLINPSINHQHHQSSSDKKNVTIPVRTFNYISRQRIISSHFKSCFLQMLWHFQETVTWLGATSSSQLLLQHFIITIVNKRQIYS